MINTKPDAAENHNSATFKANLRLWSNSEPLGPVVNASRRSWPHLDVKGQETPARGRVKAHIAPKHYASSEDIKYDNIKFIVPVLSEWLDEIENGVPPIMPMVLEGKVEAVLWVAIFGYDEVATPVLPKEIDERAKRAGVQILLENYTTNEPEDGNSAKTFLGAGH